MERNKSGYWLGPAVLAIYFVVSLLVIGPSSPDAAFEAVFRWLSGLVVVGLRAPLWLLIAGVVLVHRFTVSATRRLTALNGRKTGMKFKADAGYPAGLGGLNDIGLGELTGVLFARSITGVNFQDGHLALKLETGGVVTIRGNGVDDSSVSAALDVPEHLAGVTNS